MLSRHERWQLREIEKSVEMDDPGFAALLGEKPIQPLPRPHYRLYMTTAVTGVVTALIGLLLYSPLLMLGGACLALSGCLRMQMTRWTGEERC